MNVTTNSPSRHRAAAAFGLAALLSIGAIAGSPAAAPAETDNEPSEVAQGSPPPDFTLTDTDGKAHHLAALKGEQPVVLVFYRGTW